MPMKLESDISVLFAGRTLKNPVFTASGTCGYADELADFMDVNALGGFITKSISLEPRKGNPIPRVVETPAGMLNAIGLANIGVERFQREKLPILESMAQAGVAVYVNIVGYTIDDYVAVAEQLAPYPGIAGFELNISCPNVKKGGISFGTDPSAIEAITQQVKAACGSKVLMVKLTPTVTDITVTARAAVNGGADALSLVNTYTAMVVDIDTRKPVLGNRTGGLSGPAIKPLAVYLVHRVYQEVTRHTHVPILGLGGICTSDDALEFIIAGATAISVGTASFLEPDSCLRVIQGLQDYCRRHEIKHITELTGSLG